MCVMHAYPIQNLSRRTYEVEMYVLKKVRNELKRYIHFQLSIRSLKFEMYSRQIFSAHFDFFE